jgi:hypothetical protein
MNLFKAIGKALSPKLQAAGFLDALIDRYNEKYRLDIDVKVSVRLVDIAPSIPKVDLDSDGK